MIALVKQLIFTKPCFFVILIPKFQESHNETVKLHVFPGMFLL